MHSPIARELELLIVIDSHNGVPVYRQLVDQVRFQIASGLLAAGDELPSTRALSAELGVNPMTVSKAYSLLEEEGAVIRRPGLPLVVSESSPDAVARARADALASRLRPAAVAAHQLGIPRRQALAIFRDILAQPISEEEQPT